MLHTQTGSIYRVILACLIALAFVFALLWPQADKRRNTAQARQAAQLVKALAFAQATYRQQQGDFTSDLRLLEVPLSCPLAHTANGPVLDCPEYTYSLLPGGLVRAEHKHLPVWLEAIAGQDRVSCHHAPEDWAGEDICKRLAEI